MCDYQKEESPKGFVSEWLLFLAHVAWEVIWEVVKPYLGL